MRIKESKDFFWKKNDNHPNNKHSHNNFNQYFNSTHESMNSSIISNAKHKGEKKFISISNIYKDLKARIEKIDKRLLESLNQTKNKSLQKYLTNVKKAAVTRPSSVVSINPNKNHSISKENSTTNASSAKKITYSDLFEKLPIFSQKYKKENSNSIDYNTNSNFISNNNSLKNLNYSTIKSLNLPLINNKESMKSFSDVYKNIYNNNNINHPMQEFQSKRNFTNNNTNTSNVSLNTLNKNIIDTPLANKPNSEMSKLISSLNKSLSFEKNNKKLSFLKIKNNIYENELISGLNQIKKPYELTPAVFNKTNFSSAKISPLLRSQKNNFNIFNYNHKPHCKSTKEQTNNTRNSISSYPISKNEDDLSSKNFKEAMQKNYLTTEDFNLISPKKTNNEGI